MEAANKICCTVVFVQIEVLGTRQSLIYQDHDRRALTRMDIKGTPPDNARQSIPSE